MKFLIALVLLATVVGCGGGGSRSYQVPTYVHPRAVNAAAFASRFEVTNKAGTPVRPVDPTGKSPFGVLLVFPGGDKFKICSATHLTRGKVVTNAHCVDELAGASKHYLVYFNKRGYKDYAEVRSIGYIGTSGGTDFAVLNLSTVDADDWDTAGTNIKDTTGFVDGTVPRDTFNVTIWSFDPGGAHGNPVDTATWNPNTCKASRTKPKTVAVDSIGDETEMTYGVNTRRDLIMDQCTRPTISGNSGSLVTETGTFANKVAVFWGSYVWTENNARNYTKVKYTGNDGIERERRPSVREALFNMATEFGYIKDNVSTNGVF